MSKRHPAAKAAVPNAMKAIMPLTNHGFKPKPQEGPGAFPPAQALPGSSRGAPPSNQGC
jgi:hypothetical protein